MDALDQKVFDTFSGRVVPKGATKKIKNSANVPTYVLEYLLGTYCTSDDEEEIEAGIEQVKRILADNYVRPDEAEKIKAKIQEFEEKREELAYSKFGVFCCLLKIPYKREKKYFMQGNKYYIKIVAQKKVGKKYITVEDPYYYTLYY